MSGTATSLCKAVRLFGSSFGCVADGLEPDVAYFYYEWTSSRRSKPVATFAAGRPKARHFRRELRSGPSEGGLSRARAYRARPSLEEGFVGTEVAKEGRIRQHRITDAASVGTTSAVYGCLGAAVGAILRKWIMHEAPPRQVSTTGVSVQCHVCQPQQLLP